MKARPSLVTAAATLLLHATLIAAVVTGLTSAPPEQTSPRPMAIELLLPPRPLPLPVTPPEARRPEPLPPKPQTKRPEPKPHVEPKPVTQPWDTLAPQVQAPEGSFESKPSPSATAALPATSAPAASAPPAPAPPVKTSASDASYASSNRKPAYPRLSRINGEEGTVVLRVLVKADGTAGTVEIRNSSGYPLLDESAKSTVQGWRFKPATVDGNPVAEWYQIAIPFTLQNN